MEPLRSSLPRLSAFSFLHSHRAVPESPRKANCGAQSTLLVVIGPVNDKRCQKQGKSGRTRHAATLTMASGAEYSFQPVDPLRQTNAVLGYESL